jgi:hypothetical protein
MSEEKAKISAVSGGGDRRRRRRDANTPSSHADGGSSSEGADGRPRRSELTVKVEALAAEMETLKVTEKTLKSDLDRILGTKTDSKVRTIYSH